MASKAKRARYTLEFKLEAVRLVKAGQSMAAVGATLGVADQTIYNWVKADREVWKRRPQYCSGLFQSALQAYSMRSSMSRRGDCWDNAPTESL
ncbi:hypothetical protein ACEQUB_p01222 (plasmid) [Ralstonia syzygii]|uniref:Transposase n=1 Tax=Ralstonia syzygii R24 TaxID=907261 RepID=G3AAV9_9RALS|nr:hypothetical protein RALSY_mp30332 [Ralstonia syzygii R24]